MASHLDRKRDVIATMKALGASGRRVFAIYLTQVMLIALVGGVIGVSARRSAALRHGVCLPRHHPAADRAGAAPGELALALLYGLLTAFAFALWPLGRAHDVPVGELFRDQVAAQPRWPRKPYIALTVAAVAVLAALAVLLSYDRRVAVIFVGTAAAVFCRAAPGRRRADVCRLTRAARRARPPCAWRSPISTAPAR